MVECLLIKEFTRPYINGAFLSHRPHKNNFHSYCPSPHRHFFYYFLCNLQYDALRKAFLKAHQGQTWKLSSRAGNYFRSWFCAYWMELIIPSPQFLELYELHWQQASVTPLPKLLVRTKTEFSLATLESRKSPRWFVPACVSFSLGTTAA